MTITEESELHRAHESDAVHGDHSHAGRNANPITGLSDYPLLDALRSRRARRFACGMEHDRGPLAYSSSRAAFPLSEEEIAALAFAACGVTGYALAELVYHPGSGGTMMGGLLGRTVSSADAVHAVSVVVTNDEGTYLLKRPQDFDASEIPELVDLVERDRLLELYQRSRIQLSQGRCAPKLEMPWNLDVNQWSLYRPGTTYFLPINEYSYMYINGLLEFLNESMAVWLVDERRRFRPAGLARFARSRGGHLHDRASDQRTLTIERIESILHSVVMVEQGMVLQNLGLMAQAMGLGGFPNFAGHEYAWFDALGFRMAERSAMSYLGAGRLLQFAGRVLRKDSDMRYPLGLEVNGSPVLAPYAPPYYRSMRDAVLAVVERKFGERGGVFRGGVANSGYKQPERIAQAAPALSDATVEATIAYCEYIFETYGRFPAYPAAFRTSVGFQASHLDLDFYDRFYRPEALGDPQRQHMQRWHAANRSRG